MGNFMDPPTDETPSEIIRFHRMITIFVFFLQNLPKRLHKVLDTARIFLYNFLIVTPNPNRT